MTIDARNFSRAGFTGRIERPQNTKIDATKPTYYADVITRCRECYNRVAMSALFDQVQKHAQMLTPQEKAALVHLLIEELDTSTDADVEQLWIEESQRRYAAYRRGELESVSGDDVMARVRSRLT